jgi:tetratricopeptide (TPR) repeat protein
MNNLALLYSEQGIYAEVEPLYKRALEMGRKAFGPDHPDVAVVLKNMAESYIEIGKKDEAERLTERAKMIHLK